MIHSHNGGVGTLDIIAQSKDGTYRVWEVLLHYLTLNIRAQSHPEGKKCCPNGNFKKSPIGKQKRLKLLFKIKRKKNVSRTFLDPIF